MMFFDKRQGYSSVTDGLTTASQSLSNSTQNATSSLSRGETIGVVVAIIGFITLMVGLTWFTCISLAKRRERRKLKESIEIEKRTRMQTNVGGGAAGDWQTNPVSIEIPPNAASMSYQDFLAIQRRGSDQSTEESFMKKAGSSQQYHNQSQQQINLMPDQYIVSFDQNGEPNYHLNGQQQQSTPIQTPNERQPIIYQSRS